MRKGWLILAALVSVSIFSGCATLKSAGSNIAEGMALYAKEHIIPQLKEYASSVAGKAKDQAIAYADKKETEKKEELDGVLAELAPIDPATGKPDKKTWQDFDANDDGHIGAMEGFKVQAYIMKNAGLKLATGEITKEEAADYTKEGAGIIGLLALLGVGGALVKKKLGGKKKDPPTLPTAPATPSA